MKIKLNNVCNIIDGDISLEEGYLNIKYGNNGIGKTSISNALKKYIMNESLSTLKPYGNDEKKPYVNIDGSLSSVLSFNMEYINNYLFENSDLLNNTYELIIKTDEFQKSVDEINFILKKIKEACSNPKINSFKTEISAISSEIKYNAKDSMISASSKFGKGFKEGVTINSVIPDEISIYKDLINFSLNYEWIKWINQGLSYVINNKCPFCKNDINDLNLKNIELLANFSSSSLMKDNLHSKEVISKISNYSEKELANHIKSINEKKDKLSQNDSINIKIALDLLNNEISKINTLLSLNPIGLKNLIGGTELSNMLQNNVINIDVFNEKDEELISAFKRINEELEQLLSKINELREKVIKMNVELAKNINKTKKYINNFLKIAGIPYCIDIVFNNDNSSRTIMKPINIDYEIDNPQNRLSYGEKNAISLVLFAVEIHSKNPNLVILDDPVSSFDSNKKYALMHYLFAEKNSYFNNKTVLFLTHDISPIIDFIKLNSFNGVNVIAHHLTNRNGNVTESQIKSSDIDSSINLEKQSAKDQTKNLIFRLAHLRRYYELLNMFGVEYNLISSLLHCYPKPQKKLKVIYWICLKMRLVMLLRVLKII